MKALNLELCKARHKTPALDGAIFETEIDPLDIETMELIAQKALAECYKLDLYVTGLSVALIAVINVCRLYEIELTCWHFNRDDNTYYPQKVSR